MDELAALEELQPRDSIPSELDRVLLRSGADELGRYLESGERVHVRQAVKRLAAKRSTPDEDAKSLQAGRGQEADRIRQFAAERYVEPARRRSQTTVAIGAGDVAELMGLQHNTPNVVSALRGRKFETLAGVTVKSRMGQQI